MTTKEDLLLTFEKCIFGLIWHDDIIGESKNYYTLLESITDQPHSNNADQDIWQLYNVVTSRWDNVRFADIRKIVWEGTRVRPDLIKDIDIDDNHVSLQKDLQRVMADTVNREMPDVREKYKNHSDNDLCTEILCCTGKRLSTRIHNTEKLLSLLEQIENTKILHVIDHSKIIVKLLQTIGVNVPEDRVQWRDNLIGRDDIRATLNEITDTTSINLTWEAWTDIIKLHIKQHIRDLQEELAETVDEEDIEEINIAIELVENALNDTSAEQFKNVGDVCHFWPPLLYPPPCFVL